MRMILSPNRVRRSGPAFRGLGASVLALSFLAAAAASALGVSLVPVGGSAVGQVGDTFSVGVDLVIGEGEFVTLAAPTLQWDLEGNNVLDARFATEKPGVMVGDVPLSTIRNDRWRLFDAAVKNDGGTLIEGDGTLTDTKVGATGLWGFERYSGFFTDDEVLKIFDEGAYAPGTYRIGVVDFLLQQAGTTTISFATESRLGYESVFFGKKFVRLSNDQVALESLDVSALGLSGLTIVVIPEPTTGLLIGIGLMILSCQRRESQLGADGGSN